MYDEPMDEDERRRRRDNDLAPHNPGIGGYDPPPGQTPPLMDLTPDQGLRDEIDYDNDYTIADIPNSGPVKPWGGDHNPPTPPTPAPTAQPTFQPPAAAPAHVASAAPTASLAKPAITDEVTRILTARLKALENPQDLTSDPAFQQSVRQYQIGQLRNADRQRKSLAERTAATGGTTSSGGFNVGVRGIEEQAGENSARYRSGLAMDRLQAREAQLVEAIRMARAIGQDEIANSLELQRLQLQQELGRGDLALRTELGRGQLNLGYDQLGLSYADLVARMNRDAVVAGL